MQRGGRGQPATRLVINGEGAHAIGIAAGRDDLTMVLADFAGRVKARLDQDITFAQPEQVREFYRHNLDRLLGLAGVEAEAITGIGLVLPGGLAVNDLPAALAEDASAIGAALLSFDDLALG